MRRISLAILAVVATLFYQIAIAQQGVYNSNTIETEAFSIGVIRIMLKEDCTIVTKMVIPKAAPFWICCDKSQHIEDVVTGKRYYIRDSDIGFEVEKYVLDSKDNFTYQEIYPPIPEGTKKINISSGSAYYVKKFELDWDIYNNALFNEKYYTPIINSLNNYKYQSVINIANNAISFCDKKFQSDYKFEGISAIHTILGLMYFNIADYQNAIRHYEISLYNSQKLSDEVKSQVKMYNAVSIAPILNNLALCHYTIGNYSNALKYANQSANYFKDYYGDKSLPYARELMSMSLYYSGMGDLHKGIQIAEQALTIIDNLMHIEDPMEDMVLLAVDLMGNSEGAEDKLDAYRTDRLLTYASLLNNLSALYHKVGNMSKSKEYSNHSLIIKRGLIDNGESFYASYLQSYINNIALTSPNSQEILNVYNDAYKYYESLFGETHPTTALMASNLAMLHLANKDYGNAIKFNSQALHTYNILYGVKHKEYLNSLFQQILINRYFDKVDALSPNISNYVYNTISFIIEQFRTLSSIERYNLWNLHNLSNIISILPQENNEDINKTIFQLLLFTKGLILSTDIEFDKVIRESGDTVLLEKFEELRTTRAILNTYYNKPIAERPEGEVERLEARAEVLEKDLLAGSKEYADFTRRLEIEWQDVQAALGDKDVAIEILAADEHIDEDTPPYYAALVLRKGWDAPKFVELCGAEELQAYFDSENGLAMMYREANSRKLYDLIWGKLAEHIDEGDNIYFSPGGLLHQVNVELLQDADGRLANEKYNLHRVSSTRELCFEKPKIAHSEAVLYGGLRYDLDSTTMIAQSRAVRPEEEFYAMRGLQLDSLRGKLNYLSASKTEVEKISKQMNQHGIKTTLYVEQIGNEESFKALSGKKTPIIHLATHGFFFKNEEAKVKPFFRMMSMNQERPRPDNSLRRSGLAFAGAQKAWDGEEIPKGIDDGVMLAQEIASMDLAGTDLVVLSACETGLGEINSEGVFGLQRAFKKAGVQTLVMSLWKVHDEATALFMQTFYDNLLSGKSKRDSFAAAQMALRKHRDYGKDPAYWAAFVMLD